MEGNLSGEGFPFFGFGPVMECGRFISNAKCGQGFFPNFPFGGRHGRAFYRPVIGMARKQQSFPAARPWFSPPFPELPADRKGRMGGTSPAWKSRKYGNREKRRGGSQRGEGHSHGFFLGLRHSLWLFIPAARWEYGLLSGFPIDGIHS